MRSSESARMGLHGGARVSLTKPGRRRTPGPRRPWRRKRCCTASAELRLNSGNLRTQYSSALHGLPRPPRPFSLHATCAALPMPWKESTSHSFRARASPRAVRMPWRKSEMPPRKTPTSAQSPGTRRSRRPSAIGCSAVRRAHPSHASVQRESSGSQPTLSRCPRSFATGSARSSCTPLVSTVLRRLRYRWTGSPVVTLGLRHGRWLWLGQLGGASTRGIGPVHDSDIS
mmetsp:Transcript_4507/g.12598  ORF Transcript_4507/g.12598 Transcript_4507/m.12598 type:complete len:229 (+) Transcript_4507:438-1124(+)